MIIHENRFTYEAKGLKKIIDLGEFWEDETGAPIPLGGIVVRRALGDDVKQALNRVMRRSVEYAFAHREASLPYVRAHAQEMSEEVMYKHIDLYVNRVLGGPRERGAARDRADVRPCERARAHPRRRVVALSRMSLEPGQFDGLARRMDDNQGDGQTRPGAV